MHEVQKLLEKNMDYTEDLIHVVHYESPQVKKLVKNIDVTNRDLSLAIKKFDENNPALKYKKALEEVLVNLRSIEAPTAYDEYIDDSIKCIAAALR